MRSPFAGIVRGVSSQPDTAGEPTRRDPFTDQFVRLGVVIVFAMSLPLWLPFWVYFTFIRPD